MHLFRLKIICFFLSLDHFIPVLLAFLVLGLVSLVLSQENCWEECLQNDLFCVEWDVKPQHNQLSCLGFCELLLHLVACVCISFLCLCDFCDIFWIF